MDSEIINRNRQIKIIEYNQKVSNFLRKPVTFKTTKELRDLRIEYEHIMADLDTDFLVKKEDNGKTRIISANIKEFKTYELLDPESDKSIKIIFS